MGEVVFCESAGYSDAMSEETEPDAPCSDKLAFDTKAQAEAAATVAEYQHGVALKAYICRHCGLFHLSTSYE